MDNEQATLGDLIRDMEKKDARKKRSELEEEIERLKTRLALTQRYWADTIRERDMLRNLAARRLVEIDQLRTRLAVVNAVGVNGITRSNDLEKQLAEQAKEIESLKAKLKESGEKNARLNELWQQSNKLRAAALKIVDMIKDDANG